MKNDKWRRIARTPDLTVHKSQNRPQTYYVAWPKTEPRRYGQRIYQAPDDREAVRIAPQIAGLAIAPQKQHMIALDKAFDETLAASRRGESARADWKVATTGFVAWLADNHPRVGVWNLLTRQIVRQYKAHCEALGLSPNAVRMRLQPIQQTDRHISAEHGMPRIAEGLNLRRGLAKQVAKVYIADALALLDALPDELKAPAALQSFAGLRLQEAYRLTWDRVDMRRGLVEISGRVKNEWSVRVIPIGKTALGYLQASPRPKVRSIQDGAPLVGNYATWGGYAAALRQAIRAWNPHVEWTGKDLRNVIATWAVTTGQRGDLLEMYMGHAPGNITTRHYVPRLGSVTQGEREEMERAMSMFREHVVDPFEAAISEAKQKGNKKKVPGSSTQSAANA